MLDVEERIERRGSQVSVIDCDLWSNDGWKTLVIRVSVLSMCVGGCRGERMFDV
jgi:hypothetical protein